MSNIDIEEIVKRVLIRLAEHLAQGGDKGRLVVVFSGATVGLKPALAQTASLALAGYGLDLVLSNSAESLYGNLVRKELAWLPGVRELDQAKWFHTVMECKAVVAPMLSLNTLSCLAALTARGLGGNILLNALQMGKPVVAAGDGADPACPGRVQLGLGSGAAGLNRAISESMAKVESFGCRLCHAGQLKATVLAELAKGTGEALPEPPDGPVLNISGAVTVAQVREAASEGKRLIVAGAGIVTALARDEAKRLGVEIRKA